MSDFTNSSQELLKKLPKCNGDLLANVSLANYNRFRCGGNAEILFIPKDECDLQNFLKSLPRDVATTVIGLGSNILIRDGGISGITIVLSNFIDISVDTEKSQIVCGAFANSLVVSNAAKKHAICGLEFLCCIPGTIGGGVVMNASSYGKDYRDILLSVRTIDRNGNIKNISKDGCKLEYRKSGIPSDETIIGATLQGVSDAEISSEAIEKKMAEMMQKKESTQPVWERCSGSAFKNPDGKTAWQLIKESGADKLTVGDAKLSEKHANFLINSGNAKSSDIENLGEEIRCAVYEKTGTMLHWEIKILGDR